MFEAALLVVVAAAAISIVAYTLRTGISPMPSSSKARAAMLAAVAEAPPGDVVDLGSGWGTLAMACARRHPERQVRGIELSWLPWLVAVAAARVMRLPNVRFERADFLRADLSGNAVLLCYLYRDGMRRLQAKLDAERAWPPLLVSSTFALPDVAPSQVVRLGDLYHTPVYLYRVADHGRGSTGPLR